MSLIFSGATFKGFSANTVKSANLPASIVPLIFSSKFCQAAKLVTARRASSGVRRNSGPRISPLLVMRLTAAEIQKSGETGVTGQSEWMEN
jgi:hypothetical protein